MNIYTFLKDHKKITLTLLKSGHSSKPKETPQVNVFLTILLKFQVDEFKPYKEWILLGQDLALVTAYTHPLLDPLLLYL